MDVRGKKIVVFGLGVTGISSIKTLSKLGAEVFVYDQKSKEEIEDLLESLPKDFKYEILDLKDFDNSFSLVIKSPGIRLDNDFVRLALSMDIEVISDIEFAYRLWGGDRIIAITGTNGKTTTTTAISTILTENKIKNRVVGNIGVGILWEMYEFGKEYFYITEVSSFQLASIRDFKPKVALILNIRPDHIDWHGSFEEYALCKKNLAKNLDKNSVLIMDNDDPILRQFAFEQDSRVKLFSLEDRSSDYYLENGRLVSKDGSIDIDRSLIKLVGNHNVQNVLAALAVCKELGLKNEALRCGIEAIKPIEHRIELVKFIKGAAYYNDSKGTNVDSTQKAVDGFEKDIILLAGGYDKRADYDILFENPEKFKSLILYGKTRYDIEKSAKKKGVSDIHICENLQEAVAIAYNEAKEGDTVLLSPACASWDQYPNFETRGRHFKELVNKLDGK